LLRALSQPWEPVFVNFMHGATRDAGWRESENEMGEVPVLGDGALRLTLGGSV
jgi:glutathione S-transferase